MRFSGRSAYGDSRLHRELLLRDYRDGAVAGLLAGTTLIVMVIYLPWAQGVEPSR